MIPGGVGFAESAVGAWRGLSRSSLGRAATGAAVGAIGGGIMGGMSDRGTAWGGALGGAMAGAGLGYGSRWATNKIARMGRGMARSPGWSGYIGAGAWTGKGILSNSRRAVFATAALGAAAGGLIGSRALGSNRAY